ncbi:MAG: photosynthetic complex assembly protein PuhC [Pseudomonadota bacterium]
MAEAHTKVYADEDRMIPKVLIRAMLALVLATLAIATFARVTDRPLVSTPPVSPVKAEASLILEADATSGSATVLWPDGSVLVELAPQDGGFIAGVNRVIVRERTKHRVAQGAPILLQAFENGRMAITDPETGWSADLMGFGETNAAAFARLLAMTQEGGNT